MDTLIPIFGSKDKVLIRNTCPEIECPFCKSKVTPNIEMALFEWKSYPNKYRFLASFPCCGLVQVPCIERNAFAATRALDANFYAMFSDGRHIVSFDDVVKVMKQTGHDLPNLYKETGIGGLAASYKK